MSSSCVCGVYMNKCAASAEEARAKCIYSVYYSVFTVLFNFITLLYAVCASKRRDENGVPPGLCGACALRGQQAPYVPAAGGSRRQQPSVLQLFVRVRLRAALSTASWHCLARF